MKYKLLTIVTTIGLFFTLNGYTQDFWEKLYFPDSVSIQCLTINEQGSIFIGTGNSQETGGVYRSTDNAQNWELVYDNYNYNILSMALNENGYIYVGKNGFSRFIVSKDNGESWEDIDLPPPSYGNVIKIYCIGQDTIYVSTWESEGAFITRSFDSGETWEYSFITDNPNEYVSDIAKSATGDIFVSLSGFFIGQGGIYKSEDGGATWEYVGLLNHQVMSIGINSNNDVFTGDWWVMNDDTPGIHALYEGAGAFDLIFDAYFVTDIAINSENHIYATANESVIRSIDNGQTFEYIDDNLSSYMQLLSIDNDGYVYAARSKSLVKSINSTEISILDGFITYPNAVGTPLSNVHINLLQQDSLIGEANTNAHGYYQFNDINNGVFTMLPSTTKLWGGITASDVLLYRKHIANISNLSGIYLASGDVNGSGDVTATDVLLIKKRIAHLIDIFPAGDWLFNNQPVMINGTNVTYNFSGICYGDANGSYVPAK